MNCVLRGTIGGLLFVLLASGIVSGQASTAQISGTVRDESGGVLPGVDVTVTQTDTGFSRSAVTDQNGAYALTNLPIGPYRLQAMLSGFRVYEQTGIVLQVGSNPEIPVTLTIGALSETVSVEAAAPLVETRSTSIGQVIENERIEELPLNGRNAADLIEIAGAVVRVEAASSRSSQGASGGVGYSVAGGQAFGVAYLLDGAIHNNPYDNFNLPLPFPDALQEFRVETSSQNAQNGFHSGASVNGEDLRFRAKHPAGFRGPRVRGRDLQPRRPDAFRQHSNAGNNAGDLGAVGAGRVLTGMAINPEAGAARGRGAAPTKTAPSRGAP